MEVVDEATYVYNYSVVEGNILIDPIEKISFETKVVDGTAGGSVIKVVIKYHTKGDASLPEAVLVLSLLAGVASTAPFLSSTVVTSVTASTRAG